MRIQNNILIWQFARFRFQVAWTCPPPCQGETGGGRGHATWPSLFIKLPSRSRSDLIGERAPKAPLNWRFPAVEANTSPQILSWHRLTNRNDCKKGSNSCESRAKKSCSIKSWEQMARLQLRKKVLWFVAMLFIDLRLERFLLLWNEILNNIFKLRNELKLS